MVEVDVFWSYALGSSFALASFRQLRQIRADMGLDDSTFEIKDMLDIKKIVKEIEAGDSPAFNNEFFLKNLLFLSLLFVPSGSNLLWSNPSWETMQVGSYETIPGWLVSGFTITNVTQGILGYWVTYNLMMKGKFEKAAWQTLLSYLGFWFILVNGWDKTGYKRFFSKDREAFDNWKWTNVFGWVGSDVVRILLAYGAVFIPLMMYWVSKWLVEGYELEGIEIPEGSSKMMEMGKVSGLLLGAIFGGTLGGAITAHLLIRRFGWVKGLVLFAGVFYGGVLKGLSPWFLKKILRVDSLEGPPVNELMPEPQNMPEILIAAIET
ncbi:MAG TPA: hypothetical protein VIK02_03715 [Candidatus Anoxymicrobiaceae bacterium]